MRDAIKTNSSRASDGDKYPLLSILVDFIYSLFASHKFLSSHNEAKGVLIVQLVHLAVFWGC